MSGHGNGQPWTSWLGPMPLFDLTREECTGDHFIWNQWKAECLRRFAIWSSRPPPGAGSALAGLGAIRKLVPTTQIGPVDHQLLEARSGGQGQDQVAGEWDGFVLYAVPSLSVVIVCFCLAICAYYFIENHYKLTQSDPSLDSVTPHEGSNNGRPRVSPSAPYVDQYTSAPPSYDHAVSKSPPFVIDHDRPPAYAVAVTIN
ncbi:hypothetical protein HDE_08662 [Halotydeus destructor]|nr:hypothetical protein HDE_08662 [Halotydeus destructor]